ncbi:hypothetical protein MHU86_15167 [Fragilaria crotonensis]|nr:hypothetical protein MHU86_15167 [Fragilaria crotonensis]
MDDEQDDAEADKPDAENGATMPKSNRKRQGYPSKEAVTFANHIDPTQLVAAYHCSSHNLKASRNQLLRSHPNGSRLLKMHETHFGWTEIEECYNRDIMRQPQITKLRQASVDVDSYSTMCVSYAKAPSARETLIEQCLFLANSLMCSNKMKELDLGNAQKIYRNAIPIFRSMVTPHTPYHIRSALNTLEYTSVVGAIFNDFFLNREVTITKDNIDAHEAMIKTFVDEFYDKWYENLDVGLTKKDRSKHFVSSITYKNLRMSVRGFFEYCRLALFKSSNPPDFILVSHSNSSSIESVFSLARSQNRDTPQGFCTSIAVQSSTEAVAVVKTFNKPAYASEDIPDVDMSGMLDLLNRKDAERDRIFANFLSRRKEIQARATTIYQVQIIFGGIIKSSLSSGYKRMLEILEGKAKQRLEACGFLGLLLADEKDFVATLKLAIFTSNEGWYKSLCCLEEDDEINFNAACSCILSHLFRNLYEASTFKNRKNVLSSYHHRLYKLMKERNLPPWKYVNDALPACLRTNDAPVCLLIQRLSDVLLEWVYDAMSQKLESEQHDNEEHLALLDKMSVLHHEVIHDDHYMKNCYPFANQLLNKGGLTLVAIRFIGFGRSLMTKVKELTVQTLLQKGNRAIEDHVADVHSSQNLKRIFWSCCNSSYNETINENKNESILQSLYVALTKKTIHAWAGMISRRFKELYTGRHANNTTKLPLRVELEASSKMSWKNKSALKKGAETEQKNHTTKLPVVPLEDINIKCKHEL